MEVPLLSHGGPPVVVGHLGSAGHLYGVAVGPRSTTSASTSSSSSQSPPIVPIISSGSTSGGKMGGSTSNGGRKYQCKMCPQVGLRQPLLNSFWFLFQFGQPPISLTRGSLFFFSTSFIYLWLLHFALTSTTDRSLSLFRFKKTKLTFSRFLDILVVCFFVFIFIFFILPAFFYFWSGGGFQITCLFFLTTSAATLLVHLVGLYPFASLVDFPSKELDLAAVRHHATARSCFSTKMLNIPIQTGSPTLLSASSFVHFSKWKLLMGGDGRERESLTLVWISNVKSARFSLCLSHSGYCGDDARLD